MAILVRTAVGKLHVQRLGREIGRAPAIFMDEAEALAYLGALVSEIFRDEFYVVVADKEFLRLERTALPYPTMAAMHESNLGLAGALRKARLRRVLLDLRKGPPGRNDKEFETEGAPWRIQLAKECERVAVLVRSAAGKLQAQRLSRDERRGGNAHVFMSEAEALAYLERQS